MKITAERISKHVPLPDAYNAGKNEKKHYLTILHDINLSVDSGTICGILGVSGSGKTTILGLLAGLDKPSTGTILWDNTEITALSEEARSILRYQQVGFIFQNFELLPQFSALENVLLPLEFGGYKKEHLEKASQALLEVGLQDRLHHFPHQLSGGEQQRVAIARAFVVEPQVLFADEPTGNLDQKTAGHIIDLLVELNQRKKTTLICVTHDPALMDFCNVKFHLVNGTMDSR